MPNSSLALVIDPLAFALRATGGVARVWATLLPRFLASDVPVRFAGGGDSKALLDQGISSAMQALERAYLIPAKFRRFVPYTGPGVFFPTSPRPCTRGVPNVQLVHDCIKDLYYAPPKGTLARVRRGQLYRNASALVAISEATRLDLVRTYGDEIRKRITVIYNPVDAVYINQCANAEPESAVFHQLMETVGDRPFAMFIGYRAGVKNFSEVTHLLKALPDHVLVAVGPPPSTDEQQMAKALQDRIIFASRVTDEVMFRLLKRSDFLFWPSMLEGFGLPIVESLLLGTPVMGLSTQVNLDVSMGLINEYESDSPSSMRASHDRMRRLGDEDPARQQLAARYDPDTVAERYLEVIRNLL